MPAWQSGFQTLIMLGYETLNAGDIQLLETANGIIESNSFQVSSFEAMGVQKTNFQVLSYDFLQKGILTSYDGMIGLDFFKFSGVLCIDFNSQIISFSTQ
jgi:hypothetical protein